MNLFTRWTGTVAVCLLVLSAARTTPATLQHDDSAMEGRGDHVMGFDHHKTTHHFTLTKTGGTIQVRRRSSDSARDIYYIQMNLQNL